MNIELNRNFLEFIKDISYDYEEIGLFNCVIELFIWIESVFFLCWYIKLCVIMGLVMFFDVFDVLFLVFVLFVLIGIWNLIFG